MTEPARFARDVAIRSAVAWTLGVFALAGLAAALARQSEDDALDLRLRAIALAGYGLAWFDEEGVFHDEVVRKETKLLGSGIDLWVLAPSGPVFRPAEGAVQPVDLPSLTRRVLASEADEYEDGTAPGGEPYRLYAMPTYDDADRLAGVIVAVGDPRQGRQAWVSFVARLAVGACALVAAGMVGSAVLARRLYRRIHIGIEEREQFLAAAAHELRTPIAALLAITESAKAGDEPALRALERVHGIATSTGDMVGRLLTWAQLGHSGLVRVPIRFDLLVDTCLADGEPAQLEPTVVQGDPVLLRVAVDNLLRNARTHGRGVRQVLVAERRVVVTDNGPGFPANASLTAAFVKGADSAGAGLGLALVARIASLHGADLRLGPGPEASLTFRAR